MDFNNIKTIAIVGASSKPEKASYHVADYLQKQGFKVIPVNPSENNILGEKCYPDLDAIPSNVKIDVIDVFRRSEQVVPVVEQAVTHHPQVIWLQEGIINEEAKEIAEQAGIKCVMDKCIKKEHALKK